MIAEVDVTPQHNHPGVLRTIKAALTSLCDTSVWLDLASIHGIMIGIITAKAPALFKVTVTRKVYGNYLWDHFQCWESFVKKFLKEEMK